MPPYVYLISAIIVEVAATSALKAADGFKNFWPSVIVVIGYLLSFYLLSVTLRFIPVGIAYAIWSGLGTVAIACIGWVIYGQRLDAYAIAGITCICVGVVMLNLLSSTTQH